MSLLSPDRLHLLVQADAVLAVSRHGRRGESRRYPAAEAEQWQGHAAAVAAALADFSGRRVRVVLGGRLSRLQLLPWRDDLGGPEEYRTWARLQFAAVYGGMVDAWEIVADDVRPGHGRIAAAMPGKLLAVIGAAVAAAGGRLESVQPSFAVAVNAWRRHRRPGDGGWLMFAEPGQVTFACRENNEWRWLRQQQCEGDGRRQQRDLFAAEMVLAGMGDESLTTLGSGPATDAGGAAQAIDLATLGAFPAALDPAYALAWQA